MTCTWQEDDSGFAYLNLIRYDTDFTSLLKHVLADFFCCYCIKIDEAYFRN